MTADKIKESSFADLAAEYKRVRAFTEELCQPLEIENYIPQPSVDVSPSSK